MATEFNYVARLDTSQIMSGLSEIRSQVGMALGGGGGFGGGGFAQTNFGGGASAGIGQMMGAIGGLSQGGGTYTDPAIAYSPHYGMQGAQTTLAQENLVFGPGGMGAAGRMAPPGVSAGEFAMAAASNNIQRSIQARQAAGLAAEGTMASVAGGLAADEAGMWVGGAIGGVVGRAAASSMFGTAAGVAGAGFGALAGGVSLGMLAMNYVGDKISDHYAEVGKILGETREMGDIVGSGRNLTHRQQGELGIAARQAAGDIKMDMNQFSDVMALARGSGMLPDTTDPGQARQKYAELASAIREGAETLHSSLSTATQVIKNATNSGLTIEEGMIRAQGGGGTGLGSMMYGMGSAAARGMGFTGAQGGQLFSGALGQASASGISGEEMTILGGRTGVAALIGGTQLQAAASPIGMMQLMAARGGQPLGGMMDLPGQALSAMGEGGDMMSNMGKFMVHGDEYRRGIGSKGVRAMALNQLEGMSDMLSDLMPGMSGNEAKRMAAMNMYGMTGTQAEAYVGGLEHRGGGDGNYQRYKAMGELAVQGQEGRLASALDALPKPEARAEFGLDLAKQGAIAGAVGGYFGPVGLVAGAAIGAGVGLIAGNAKALWQRAGDAFGDIGHIFDSAEEKADRRYRNAMDQQDRSEEGIKNKLGFIPADAETIGRTMGADLSGVSLKLTSGNFHAREMTEGALRMAGLTPVAAGAGTMQIDGKSWSSSAIQGLARNSGGKALTQKQLRGIDQAAYEAAFDPNAKVRFNAGATPAQQEEFATQPTDDLRYSISVGDAIQNMNSYVKTFQEGKSDSEGYKVATSRFTPELMSLTRGIKDEKTRARYQKEIGEGKFISENDEVRVWAERMGVDMKPLAAISATARIALGAAAGDTRADQENLRDGMLVAMGMRPGGNTETAMKIAHAATGTAAYRELQGEFRRGNVSGPKVDSLLREAMHSGVVSSGVKNDDTFAIDKMHAGTVMPGAQAQRAREKELADIDRYTQGMESKGWTSHENAAKENAELKAALGDVKPDPGQAATLAVGEKNLAKVPGKGRPRGPGTAEHTVGFGEQESALRSINKSLERTGKMLQSLQSRMDKIPSGGAPKAAGET